MAKKQYKKDIDTQMKRDIMEGKIGMYDMGTGEVVELKEKILPIEKKTILSNKKKFMKKRTDRKMNIAIKQGLSLIEKEMILDIYDYIDEENVINFVLLQADMGYPSSKLSKVRKLLTKKNLIRKVKNVYYLNPLLGIKGSEMSYELIQIFKDSFKTYGVEVQL